MIPKRIHFCSIPVDPFPTDAAQEQALDEFSQLLAAGKTPAEAWAALCPEAQMNLIAAGWHP